MKKFIGYLSVVPTIQDPLDVFYDNECETSLAKEPRSHKKTKNISRRFNFIHYKVKESEISIRKVHTDQNFAILVIGFDLCINIEC